MQPIEKPLTDCFPRDALHGAGIKLGYSLLDLCSPRGIDIWVRLSFERFNQQPR
jgi:hypothetical protein